MTATPVQTARGNTGSATAGTLTITLGSAPTQYNSIILAVCCSVAVSHEVSQTGVSWSEVMPSNQNATGPTCLHIFYGFVWSPSAGTAITVTLLSTGASASAGVAAEFAGANLSYDAQGVGSANSGTASASVTPNIAPSLVVSVHGTRSATGYTGHPTIFSAPTNSFVLVDSTNGFENTTIGTTTSDRAVAMFVKYVTDTSAQTCSSTLTTAQWAALMVNFYEKQTGFMVY